MVQAYQIVFIYLFFLYLVWQSTFCMCKKFLLRTQFNFASAFYCCWRFDLRSNIFAYGKMWYRFLRLRSRAHGKFKFSYKSFLFKNQTFLQIFSFFKFFSPIHIHIWFTLIFKVKMINSVNSLGKNRNDIAFGFYG